MVYASEVDGKKLTFQVSGQLWQRSLVMRDLETESLWSHILGECMQGELKGKKLELIPAEMTTWKQWLADHPQTTVLDMSPTAKRFDRECFKRMQPVFVITARQVVPRIHAFAGKARLVQVPLTQQTAGQGQAEHFLFPRVGEGLRLIAIHRTESLHTSQVMGAVHGAGATGSARPVPIIESRVTRSASSSSLSDSLPTGRRGNTR